MEVQVSPETARKLNELAASTGRAPGDIVEDALAGYLEEVAAAGETLDTRYDDLKSRRVKPIDGDVTRGFDVDHGGSSLRGSPPWR